MLLIAVFVPVLTAIILGITLGKLRAVGPLLENSWYATFIIAVIAQIAAIVGVAALYMKYREVGLPYGAEKIILAVGAASVALSLVLAVIMYSVPRDSCGSAENARESVGGGIGAIETFGGGGEVLVVVLVCSILAGVSFYPLRFVVRTTSKILHYGLLKA